MKKIYFYIVIIFSLLLPNLTGAQNYYYRNLGPELIPQRIVSLAPSITEILFAVNAEDKIIGVTDFCNYPAQTKKKVSVGGLINPNPERIIGLNPDLVISASGNKESIFNKLNSINIPVLILPAESIKDIFYSIDVIGKIVGKEKQADIVVQKMTRDLNHVQEKISKTAGRPRVLFLVSNDPIMAVGKHTFANDLIEMAGGENITGNSLTKYPLCGLEEIVAKKPEVIILSSMGSNKVTKESLLWWQKWPILPAIQNKRLYIIEADLIHRPSPRITEGLKLIAGYLHPGM